MKEWLAYPPREIELVAALALLLLEADDAAALRAMAERIAPAGSGAGLERQVAELARRLAYEKEGRRSR